MKKITSLFKSAIICILISSIISCSDDDDGIIIDEVISNTVTDVIRDTSNFSSFYEALQLTGVDATLAGSGNFTVFVPNNAAFDVLLGGASLTEIDTQFLTQLLLNHILNIELTAADLTTGYQKNLAREASTNANIDTYIDTSNGVIINGQSTVVNPNTEADNGVIHEVDVVIDLPTIVTFAITNPALSDLVTALTDEGNTTFTDLLSDTNADFTVFAPTNDAFTTFLGTATIDDVDNDILSQLLSNHVIPGTVAIASSLSNSYVNTAAVFDNQADAPLSMYINTDDGVTINGEATVSQADIVAVNGVIHVIDSVIPLPDVTTFTFADPNFSSLQAALMANPDIDYITALQTPLGESTALPFTGFAPTNDAFVDLLDDLGLNSLEDIPLDTLMRTLELHTIISMNLRAEDIIALDGMPLTTFIGDDITVDASIPGFIDPTGGASTLTVTDLQTANGVVHVLNRVLRNL